MERAFFPTLKDRVGGGMVHRHNSYISSQMKLKLGSNIIWIMFTSNSGGKGDDVIVILFL